jgi:hypothetical protein
MTDVLMDLVNPCASLIAKGQAADAMVVVQPLEEKQDHESISKLLSYKK